MADTMLPHVAPLYGLVLVGGESRRMGQPKWAFDYHGEPHGARTARLLEAVCERVFVSVRSGPAPDGLDAWPAVEDAPGLCGPAAGIRSAMAAYPGAAFLVAACDLPHLDAATLAALVAGRDAGAVATAFRSAHGGLPEPLCAVWEPRAGAALAEAAVRGVSCPRKVLLASAPALLDLPDPRALDNANTPDEAASARRLLGTPV